MKHTEKISLFNENIITDLWNNLKQPGINVTGILEQGKSGSDGINV